MNNMRIGVALTAVILLSGCVTSRQARTIKPSAFLGQTAALLQKGETGDDTLLVYRNERAAWHSFDKILLDPVEIWSEGGSGMPSEEAADFQRMVDSFHLTLREKLSQKYEIVDGAAPGALRIQMALVNGAQANQTLKVAKLVAPYAGVADFLWTFVTGKPAFAGEVSLEYMIKDSQTGELLEAGADRRVGGNQLGRATFTTWGDVKNILTYWSDLTVYRLCVHRGDTGCRRPGAGLTQPAVPGR